MPSGTLSNLSDVHYPTSSVAYAVGDFGVVLKSIDSGLSWQTVYTDSLLSFSSVFFTSIDTGYATSGSLYKTTNAGVSWSKIISESQIGEVCFVNSNLGFASGAVLYRTTDAGNSWVNINLNNTFSTIHFPNDSVGYFVGGAGGGDLLYKTVDRGQTFLQLTNGFQSIKEATCFLNSNIGYICGWYNGLLAKTIDGGVSWQQIDTLGASQCWEVHFVDENTGYYIDNSGGNYKILKTTNGGTTWSAQLVGNGIYLIALYFLTSSKAIAVGNNGTIFLTNNGGGLAISEENKIRNGTIYPNPFTSSTTIETRIDLKNATLVLYDFTGRQVKRLDGLNGPSIYLHRGNLQSGIYFIRITQNNETVVSDKIIIND